jgi:trans-aconitate 2-methyltransferase
MWNARDYLKFSAERSRPFADLLSQVRKEQARTIADLGCGTGNLTRVLAERWPTARVVGIDDLLVSNAALQWVGDHDGLLMRLTGTLAADGILAVQLPSRFGSPMYVAIEETAAGPRWASRLKGVGLHRESVKPVVWYVQRLRELGFTANAWETTYIHVLTGENPVLDWLKGTALRPLLERLGPEDEGEFMQELGRRLKVAYPGRGDVTLFSMPRLFFVATRAG